MIPPEVIAAAKASHAKVYPLGPFVSVILAQWAVESGYGKHVSGTFNYFGIKATEGEIAAHHATQCLTTEWIRGVRHDKVPQWFANYDSLEDCFDAHARLLLTPHYKQCQQARTVEEYCMALQDCGYATVRDSEGRPNYAAILMNTINGADLKQYDERPAPKAQEPPKPAGGKTAGKGNKTMASNGPTISDFLQFLQDIPFDKLAKAAASGGRNVAADIDAAEAIFAALSSHFFGGGTAATAHPVIEAALPPANG